MGSETKVRSMAGKSSNFGVAELRDLGYFLSIIRGLYTQTGLSLTRCGRSHRNRIHKTTWELTTRFNNFFIGIWDGIVSKSDEKSMSMTPVIIPGVSNYD